MNDRFKKLRDEHEALTTAMRKLIGTAKAGARTEFTISEANNFRQLEEQAFRVRERMETHVESQREILAELQGTRKAS